MGTARDDIALQLVHRRLRHPGPEGCEDTARRAKRVAVAWDSLHRHDSTAREMTSVLAHRGSILLDFASREICPFKSRRANRTAPIPIGLHYLGDCKKPQ
jgi:hypothetical protein